MSDYPTQLYYNLSSRVLHPAFVNKLQSNENILTSPLHPTICSLTANMSGVGTVLPNSKSSTSFDLSPHQDSESFCVPDSNTVLTADNLRNIEIPSNKSVHQKLTDFATAFGGIRSPLSTGVKIPVAVSIRDTLSHTDKVVFCPASHSASTHSVHLTRTKPSLSELEIPSIQTKINDIGPPQLVKIDETIRSSVPDVRLPAFRNIFTPKYDLEFSNDDITSLENYSPEQQGWYWVSKCDYSYPQSFLENIYYGNQKELKETCDHKKNTAHATNFTENMKFKHGREKYSGCHREFWPDTQKQLQYSSWYPLRSPYGLAGNMNKWPVGIQEPETNVRKETFKQDNKIFVPDTSFSCEVHSSLEMPGSIAIPGKLDKNQNALALLKKRNSIIDTEFINCHKNIARRHRNSLLCENSCLLEDPLSLGENFTGFKNKIIQEKYSNCRSLSDFDACNNKTNAQDDEEGRKTNEPSAQSLCLAIEDQSQEFSQLADKTKPTGYRPSFRFSRAQVQYLEYLFDRYRYINKDQRATIAQNLRLEEKQILTWFQNRRAKLKRLQHYAKGCTLR